MAYDRSWMQRTEKKIGDWITLCDGHKNVTNGCLVQGEKYLVSDRKFHGGSDPLYNFCDITILKCSNPECTEPESYNGDIFTIIPVPEVKITKKELDSAVTVDSVNLDDAIQFF